MVNDPERLTLSVPEAAKILGVHVQTAYVMARRGDIPVLRLGGRLLVKRLELERMLGAEAGK
jgi:excisionase family DNA binding protein